MKKYVITCIFISIVLTFIGCTTTQNQDIPSAPTTAKLRSAIVLPQDLVSCPDELVASPLSKETEKQCASAFRGEFCSYYQSEKDDGSNVKNLQFMNECSLCKTHGQKGSTFTKSNSESYTHLGYEKKPCYQGPYKKE
jgi:hypothetical protein